MLIEPYQTVSAYVNDSITDSTLRNLPRIVESELT